MNTLDIQYIGEWLWAGRFGHLLTLVSMMAAFMATVSYWRAACLEDNAEATTLSLSWQRLGRIAFSINVVSVIGIGAVLFFLIFNHRFEFKYVWQHSSSSLPVYYMISCFWEGQEGSFWLWAFWTGILGALLIGRSGRWENRVMSSIGLMQFFLAAMLIGIYFIGYKIGSSPFILFREDQPNMPLFMRADYLQALRDGNGLNPLLQNYWMVIHPPTLFLGFALTLIPASYTLAALWKRDFSHWVRPTLLWSLLGGAVLGTGILMGGAWAYEALSFGGFWAWDPVENASLVPWLVLIGGIHTLLAYKHSGHALHVTAILLLLSLLLVLYSTFLTRSGILGSTSVHSFTDLGMSGQLLVFMFSFVALSVGLLIYGWRHMPSVQKEESPYSREFWLFVGSLTLLMLSVIVSIDTSWPVINKIFGTKRTIADAVVHYNRYAIWFGIVLALLSATIQFMRYKTSNMQKLGRNLLFSLSLSLLLTLLISYSARFDSWVYGVFLFCALYAVIANTYYFAAVLSGKIKVAGGSIAHIGMGLMLLGILFSSAKKEVISINALNIDFGGSFKEKDNRENILLEKNSPAKMGNYWVVYEGDSAVGIDRYFKVRYEQKENQDDPSKKTFYLYPHAQLNPKMGLLANPSTKRFWYQDLFTHVSSIAQPQDNETGETLSELELGRGDTAAANNCRILLREVNPRPAHPRYLPMAGDIAVGAHLEILTAEGKKYEAEPVYFIRDNQENSLEVSVEKLNMTIKFNKIVLDKKDLANSKIKLSVVERTPPKDFIIMKAIVFPGINLLWLGCFVMVTGFGISLLHRRKEKLKG